MLQFNFSTFPCLDTERLELKRITMDHIDDLFVLRTNVDAMKHLGKPIPREKSEIEDLIRKIETDIQSNTAIAWGISFKGTNRVIATMSYHRIKPEHYRAEIGYMLLPEYWRQGLMSEVMPVVLNYGFNQMMLHSIEAQVDPTNEKSIGLLEKFGFEKEAHFKENFFFNGQFLDTGIYSLLKRPPKF